MTQPEGQTARDVFPEDDGQPDLQDGTPMAAEAEDPEFAPQPGERANASVDFGTTAAEQAEGEDLDGRLAREEPEVDVDPGVRPAEDPDGPAALQLDQDADADPRDSSGTASIGDDVLATGEEPMGGEGPEERAVHPVED